MYVDDYRLVFLTSHIAYGPGLTSTVCERTKPHPLYDCIIYSTVHPQLSAPKSIYNIALNWNRQKVLNRESLQCMVNHAHSHKLQCISQTY